MKISGSSLLGSFQYLTTGQADTVCRPPVKTMYSVPTAKHRRDSNLEISPRSVSPPSEAEVPLNTLCLTIYIRERDNASSMRSDRDVRRYGTAQAMARGSTEALFNPNTSNDTSFPLCSSDSCESQSTEIDGMCVPSLSVHIHQAQPSTRIRPS